MIYHVLGLMSGTSLDGLDICYARFEKKDRWNFKILQAETFVYPAKWENKLRASVNLSSESLLELHSEYGFYLGELVSEFLQKYQLEKIDFIASHGHTVFHNPSKKFTFQLGDGRALKTVINHPIIYDFRSQDVLKGGNGAPLVPIGDEFLFSEYEACLNLGGFSNISFKKDGKRRAFDICPVNILLNDVAQQTGHKYDCGGKIARTGKINEALLDKLNQIEFYKAEPPKSLGTEWVEKQIKPLLQRQSPEDLLATFTEHAAVQIAKVIREYALKNVLVTGGGAFNDFLVEKIRNKTEAEIVVPDQKTVEFKEALIFAFMGVLRWRNEHNVMSSATGSSEDHCSGVLV